jgi:hypothetical protein
MPIDAEEECSEFVPVEASLVGITDDGRRIFLDVHVLLDGVSTYRATQVMEQVQKAYAPLNISLRTTFQAVSFPPQRVEPEFVTDADSVPVSDSAYFFTESKAAVGGTRPPNVDVVYLLTSDRITGTTAGVADCIGGIRYPDRAFAIGEHEQDAPRDGIAFCCTWTTAKIAAHEIAHLLGAHHHYANCAEGAPAAVDDSQMFTCTLMFNDVGAINLAFSSLEAAVVRGHALKFADRPDETVEAEPEPESEPEPEPEPEPSPSSAPDQAASYMRSLSLELVRHLVARGRVDSPEASACAAGVEVRVERRKGGRWIEIGQTTTGDDGRFRLELPDRSGTYRAVVDELSQQEESEPYTCDSARSAPKKYRHN